MKLLKQDYRHGEVKLVVENQDDLWYLSTIIEPGDSVRGQTERKVRVSGQDERTGNVTRAKVTLTVSIEKCELGEDARSLRAFGMITEAPEHIPAAHHTIVIEEGMAITIRKEEWLNYQIARLKEAQKKVTAKILIALFDREEAHFALLRQKGYRVLSSLKGDVEKKEKRHRAKGNFWADIISAMKEYDKRYNLDRIVIASPSFWKEELLKELKDADLKRKLIQATCSSADATAIDEVLKRPETRQALHEDRIAKELSLVDEMLLEIRTATSQGSKAQYGFDHVKAAAEQAAVKHLLVTDAVITTRRRHGNAGSDGTFAELDAVMRLVEQNKGEITIITSEYDAGRRLDGLGGIGALLRYRV